MLNYEVFLIIFIFFIFGNIKIVAKIAENILYQIIFFPNLYIIFILNASIIKSTEFLSPCKISSS